MVFVLFAIVETELGVVHSALKRDTIKTSRSLNSLRVCFTFNSMKSLEAFSACFKLSFSRYGTP